MGFLSAMARLGLAHPSASEPSRDTQSPPSAASVEALRYPPVDPGIPVCATDDLLAAHEPLIDRIKLCYGADRETFENDLLQLIRNYADFVNLLPATPDNYFAGPGGLFRLGLEVAFYSLQGTDAHIVCGRSTISERRHIEPRWRHATFIAGLCCELHRTLSHVVVTDDRGDEWPAYLLPLTLWLAGQRASRFFVRWIANAHETRALGLFALPYVVPGRTLQHLGTRNNMVVPHLLSSLSGMPLHRDHNVLDELVRRSAALVIDRDLIASAHRYGKPILGAHLERYLLDAMRRLVASNAAWSPNQERSRVWLSQEGLFVVWPNGATEIRKLLEADELPGIPKAPETILEILATAGVLAPHPDGGHLWRVCPPPGKTVLEAIKLHSPEILLAGLADRPEPISGSLLANAAPSAAPSSPPPADAAESPAPVADGQSCFPFDDALPTSTAPDGHPQSPQPASVPEDPPPASALPSPVFKLNAPMRLAPAIREALASIVETLNGDATQAAACTVAAGVFIPLSELERRKIDTALALRTIADAGMAVGTRGQRVKTIRHDFAGRDEIGFVLSPNFVEGLDPGDFLPPA